MASDFTLGTLNVGDAPNAAVINSIRGLFASTRCDAITLQEMGDRGAVLNRLESLGFLSHTGAVPGSPSTPVVWNPARLELVDEGVERLTVATKVGDKGAGPSTMKPKNLVWTRFNHPGSGRSITVGSTHVVPSVYLPPRRKLAREHMIDMAAFVQRTPGLLFIGGDMNMLPDNSLLDPLRLFNMKCTHLVGDTVPTHGRRAIDHVWYRYAPKRVKFVFHTAIKTESDHKALVARFVLTNKRPIS